MTTHASATHPGDPAVGAVAEHVRSAVLEISGALAAVIDALPHPVHRPADFQRALGLQPPLAWRIYRLSRAADISDAVEHLPTVGQLERVVAKASGAVPPEVAARAAAAVERFAEVVREVGGDQRGFESVASGLAPAGVRRVEIEHRRWAFRGNTHLWGLQARCLAACGIERPGAEPGTRDVLAIRGILGLQASRADVPVRIQARLHVAGGKLMGPPEEGGGSSGRVPGKSELRVLPPLTEPGGAPAAGSKPPELHTVQSAEGWEQTEIRLPGIGRSEAVSFFLHQAFRGAEDDGVPGLGMLVEVPAEWLQLDFLVPRGLADPSTAESRVYACRDEVKRAYTLPEEDRAPLHEQVEHFAGRDNVPVSREIPHWPGVVRRVLEEEGWWGAQFDVYRCMIAYPMLHAWTGLVVDRAEG